MTEVMKGKTLEIVQLPQPRKAKGVKNRRVVEFQSELTEVMEGKTVEIVKLPQPRKVEGVKNYVRWRRCDQEQKPDVVQVEELHGRMEMME